MTIWDKEKYKADGWIEMKTDVIPLKKGRKPGKTLGIWMQLDADQQCRLRRLKITNQCDTWSMFVDLVLEIMENEK